MTKDETKELLFAGTQSLLSLIVVIGGGLFLFQNPNSDAIQVVTALVTAVLTYYFSQAIASSATNNANKVAAETKRSNS